MLTESAKLDSIFRLDSINYELALAEVYDKIEFNNARD